MFSCQKFSSEFPREPRVGPHHKPLLVVGPCPEAAMLYPQQRHTGQPSSCWGWPILMPRVHHQLHMAHNLSPASILAEILSSGPTVIIMAPACANESPAAVPQSSGVHVGPTAWFLAQKVQLHQPPLLLLMSEYNTTTASFDSTTLTSGFPSLVCEVLVPVLAPVGAAPATGTGSRRCEAWGQLLLLANPEQHLSRPRTRESTTTTTARTSSVISVVVSQHLKHQPSAAEIFVVVPLYLKHQPSRRYEAKPSTAIKC